MFIGRWFVAFVGAERRKHLVDWISPLWCQHVFCFGYDAAGKRWLIYDVSREGTSIVALQSERFDDWLYMMRRQGVRILTIERAPARRFWAATGIWCVVAVRHVIGAPSRALRPIGLWRDLLKHGAEEAFVEEESCPAHST